MIIGVLREPTFETRVSVLPDMAAALIKKGVQVYIEKSAGERAFASDPDYALVGAIIHSREHVIKDADVILCMHPPEASSLELFSSKILIGLYQPLYYPDTAAKWASLNITSFSLDMLPRTTRAQSMDVLSSQANIAGYKAVLTGCEYL